MAIFNWDDSFCVGIEEVDRQHQRLVSMINRLDEAISTGGESVTLSHLLTNLFDYTRYHFQTEEALMRAHHAAPQHYERHKASHDDFVKRLGLFSRRLQGVSEQNVANAVLDFLVKWLANHILGEDRDMVRAVEGFELLDNQPARSSASEQSRDLELAERQLLGALRESEYRFRILADSVPVLIWMSGRNGKRHFFNKPWFDFTGCTLDQLLDGGWRSRIHPQEREGYLASFTEEVANQRHFVREYRLQGKDGSYRWFLETAVPRYQSQHQFVGYVGSLADISERKAAERVLEYTRDRLEREVADRTRALVAANMQLKREEEEQRTLIDQLEEAHNQLLQSEKMASIGQLAAGVAHEINNPVGYVKSNLATLGQYVRDLFRLVEAYERQPQPPEAALAVRQQVNYDFLRHDLVTLLEETAEGVDRIEHIVQALKEFSHVDEAEWQFADLHRGLDNTLNLISKSSGTRPR